MCQTLGDSSSRQQKDTEKVELRGVRGRERFGVSRMDSHIKLMLQSLHIRFIPQYRAFVNGTRER